MDSKSIHSFHITHNNSDYPSKFSMRTVFPFSQDDYNTQEKLKTIHMQKHGGGGGVQTKCIIGVKVPKKNLQIFPCISVTFKARRTK